MFSTYGVRDSRREKQSFKPKFGADREKRTRQLHLWREQIETAGEGDVG